MWTRAQLKEKAKSALSANYWKVLLVTLVVFMIGGASTGASLNLDTSEMETAFEEGFSAGFEDGFYYEGNSYYEDEFEFGYNDDYVDDDYYFEPNYDEELETAVDFVLGIMIIGVLVIAIVGTIIGFLLSVFIYNPLEIGTKRFFFKNLNQPAEVKEVAFAFDNNYKNTIKILLIRGLKILGWSLLFVIPGIVKAYEYLMIPYLLAENPNLTKDEVFALSKQMMTGHKWNAFVLDLSFFGWDILSSFTLGLLSIFYVTPYKCLTYAALYEELSLMNGRPAFAQPNMESTYQQVNPYTQPVQQAAQENTENNTQE